MSVLSERRRVQAAIPLQPCLPRRADTPPTGEGWIHEIKHDGFRILARRDGDRVRLFTRNGFDFTARYPKITAALDSLPVRSCVVERPSWSMGAACQYSIFSVIGFAITPRSYALSISSNSTAKTFAGSRWNIARQRNERGLDLV